MATTIKTVSTLDVNFHVNDGTVTGDSLVWKFNDPVDNLTLGWVKEAFGYNSTTGEIDHTVDAFLSYATGQNPTFQLLDKNGNLIDGIDGATITTVVTTKNELS